MYGSLASLPCSVSVLLSNTMSEEVRDFCSGFRSYGCLPRVTEGSVRRPSDSATSQSKIQIVPLDPGVQRIFHRTSVRRTASWDSYPASIHGYFKLAGYRDRLCLFYCYLWTTFICHKFLCRCSKTFIHSGLLLAVFLDFWALHLPVYPGVYWLLFSGLTYPLARLLSVLQCTGFWQLNLPWATII